MSDATVPVLTYHSIDPSGSVISTSRDKFRAQMQHLRDQSFRVMSLRDLVDRLRRHDPLPDRAVAITFDDGFRNMYVVAYPVVRECGCPATPFMVAGRCGGNNQWPGPPGGVPPLDVLDWARLAEMQANGIGVGAHTLDPPDLSQLSIGDATREIVGSTTLIQERLGTDVQLFAYPYGRDTAQLRAAVRQHGAGAGATEVRVKTSARGRHRLPRIDMYYFSRNDRCYELGRAPFQRYVAWRRAWRFVRPVDAWRARR